MLSPSLSPISNVNEAVRKFIFTDVDKKSSQLIRRSLTPSCITIIVLTVFLITINQCNGHGRLIEPPSRASAWRYGFQTPPNYNDHELYCGGFQRQQRNGGKCGECGDAWDLAEPRPNEYGGKWGQGVVVRQYKVGSEITLRIELTASHMGYFEFRICPNISAKQECLDKHLLELINGSPSIPHPNDLSTRFYPRNGSRIYDIKGKLPDDLACPNCVLQWRYIAGNNWGICPDGKGAVGCGPQEEFRACADINIGDVGPVPPLRPVRPGTKSPTVPTTTTESTIETEPSAEQIPRYMGPIIAFVALLLVLCVLAAIYLYYYHGKRVKHLMRWKRDKTARVSPVSDADVSKAMTIDISKRNILPPVPPPRTKRLSQSLQEISPSESSISNGSGVERGRPILKN